MLNIIVRDLLSDLDQQMMQMHTAIMKRVEYETPFESLGRNFPKVNIDEQADAFIIEAAVPGYKKEEVKLEVTEVKGRSFLTLKGEKAGRGSDHQLLCREIHFSSFHRSWQLPEKVDATKITSKLGDGILRVEIPKTEVKATKREIDIR